MKKTILLFLLAGIAFCSAPVRAQAIAIPEAEKAAIVQTALDYGDGYYSGAAERMERALHPDLNKVWTRVLPQTKTVMIGYSTFSGLVEGTRAKMGYTEPDARKIRAEALFMNDDVAGAKVTSAQFNDFLQMVKVEGQWKIVNVLWVPGPDSRFRQPLTGFILEKEQAAAKKAALGFRGRQHERRRWPGGCGAASGSQPGRLSGSAADREKTGGPQPLFRNGRTGPGPVDSHPRSAAPVGCPHHRHDGRHGLRGSDDPFRFKLPADVVA